MSIFTIIPWISRNCLFSSLGYIVYKRIARITYIRRRLAFCICTYWCVDIKYTTSQSTTLKLYEAFPLFLSSCKGTPFIRLYDKYLILHENIKHYTSARQANSPPIRSPQRAHLRVPVQITAVIINITMRKHNIILRTRTSIKPVKYL